MRQDGRQHDLQIKRTTFIASSHTFLRLLRSLIVWLAPRACKIKRVLCSDWLPERARWTRWAARDCPLCSRKSEILWCVFRPYNKSFIDRDCSVMMAGYWRRSLFVFLWTSTSFRKKKKELGQHTAILTSRLVNNAYIKALFAQRRHGDKQMQLRLGRFRTFKAPDVNIIHRYCISHTKIAK